MEMPATFSQHPYAWGGGALALVVLYMYARSGSSASTASSGTAVVSSTLDPTAAALTAQQMQDNVALTTASLQAQTQQSAITAATTINQQNTSAAVQAASINANVVNAQTAASIFGTATNGLLENNAMSSNAADTSGVTTADLNAGANYNGQGLYGAIEQWDPGWQSWMNNDIGGQVPVYGQTNSGPATNTTANQMEEMFNNVIRAGQGTAPLQTVTMQPSSGTGIVGSATIDPVFAVWDGSSSVPTITDVTLNPQSQYGYTGSVFNPATSSSAVNITPNAVPTATTAQLPKFTLPAFGGLTH